MEDLSFTITKEKLESAIKLAVDEVLKSTYSNPFVDAIKDVLKDNKGIFQETFSAIISEMMSTDEFKKQLGDIAMKSLVEGMIKNNR